MGIHGTDFVRTITCIDVTSMCDIMMVLFRSSRPVAMAGHVALTVCGTTSINMRASTTRPQVKYLFVALQTHFAQPFKDIHNTSRLHVRLKHARS